LEEVKSPLPEPAGSPIINAFAGFADLSLLQRDIPKMRGLDRVLPSKSL
jgi:hypothetical protein